VQTFEAPDNNLMLDELHDPHTYAVSPEAVRNAD